MPVSLCLEACAQPGCNQIKPDLPSTSDIVCYFPLNFGFAIQRGRSWLAFCDPLHCWAQRSLLCSPISLCCFLCSFGFWLQPRIIFSHHNWGSSNIATVGHRHRIPCNESLWHLFLLPREFVSVACPSLQGLLQLPQQLAHCVMMGGNISSLLSFPLPHPPPSLGEAKMEPPCSVCVNLFVREGPCMGFASLYPLCWGGRETRMCELRLM